ncbi:Luciferase-like monooxygenase family protein [Yersinia pseudotuberculosis]|nr:Luciferase-like monooxygenase family protein [Yersinia pseudotuberculosis]
MMALRRHLSGEVDNFPADVRELQNYFAEVQPAAASARAACSAVAARLQSV